jgi:hypothetical protein
MFNVDLSIRKSGSEEYQRPEQGSGPGSEEHQKTHISSRYFRAQPQLDLT